MSSNSTAKKIRYALRCLPDEVYIQLNYFAHFHRLANLKHPKTYNEKLNWLKLHDHNPIYPEIVDKYKAKAYVEKHIGGGYCIPTLGVWDSYEDIDFKHLPDSFVLKCTHDSEGVVIVKNKSSMDMDAAREKITAALKQNFYYIGREWPYKHVKPRIIAEPYLEDVETGELRDYKFFCFDGVPKFMYIASGRSKDQTTFDFYDLNFTHMDIRQKYPNSIVPQNKPVSFEKMIELSEKLSQGFSHVRVDFYEVNGRPYVGELTLYSMSGFLPFLPSKWDKIFGDWLEVPQE